MRETGTFVIGKYNISALGGAVSTYGGSIMGRLALLSSIVVTAPQWTVLHSSSKLLYY